MEKLPNEMLVHISSYLNFEELDILKQVNERFGQISKLRLVKQYFFLMKQHRKLLSILTDKFQRELQYLKSPRSRILFFQLSHCLKAPHDHCPINVSGELLRVIFRMCAHFRSKADFRELSAFWERLEKSLAERGRSKRMEISMGKKKRPKTPSSASFVLSTYGYFSDDEPKIEKVREKFPKY